jgi:hypothetical protein
MRDPNPAAMPVRALVCAVAACRESTFASDREFAAECALELGRRTQQEAHPRHAENVRRKTLAQVEAA